MFTVILSVSALAGDGGFDKIFSLSDVYKSINFDEISELFDFTGSFEFKDGIFGADGRVLKVSDTVFDFPSDISHAKSSAVFDIFIPGTAVGTNITVNLENGAKVFDFYENNGEISVKCGDDEVFKILSGKHYKFGISADLDAKKFYIGIEKFGVKSFNIADNDVIKSVRFVSESDFYIDGFTVLHNVFAVGSNPVLYRNGAFAAAECVTENDGEKSLVLAKYSSDGSVSDVSVKNFDKASLQRVYLDYRKDCEYRAFLWSGHLTPEAVKDIKTAEGIFLSDIVFLKNYTVSQSGNGYVFTAGKPLQSKVSGYFYTVKKDGVEIINKKVSRSSAEGEGIKLDLTSFSQGAYELNVFIEYDGKYRAPFADESFCVFKNDGFYAFSVGSEKYFCRENEKNFEDGFVPFYANSKIYLADFVLRKNFGIDVKDGRFLSINGEKFELSDGDFVSADGALLVSLEKLADALGLAHYFDKNGVFVMSANDRTNEETAEEYKEYFEKYIISDDFSGKLTWQKIPEGWSFFDWGTSSNKGNFAFSEFGNTEKSVYLGAVEKSYAGVQSDVINIDKNGTGYTVSVEVYGENYAGNNVGIALMMRKGNTFAKMISGTVDTMAQNGKWMHVTANFAKDAVEENGNTSFRVLIYTRRDASAESVSGGIYVDNARLKFTDYISDSYKINVTANDKFSWYTLGENVIYTTDAGLSGTDKIEGVIYSDGAEIFRKTVSAYTFSNSGFVYTPDKPGYYEVQFFAVRSDGAKVPIVSYYNKVYDGISGDFELSRRSFAVTDGMAKDFDERNQKLFVSSHSTDSDDLEAGVLLGFYGARIHWIRWGDSATVKGAHTAPGTFDWTNIDKQYQNVKNSGYRKIAANIYGTPRWAVKEENRNKTDYTIAGSIRYNNFAPEKQEYLDEFLTAFVERYGKDTDIIEFWNEPQSGNTAFWADGTENFSKMLKTAYTSIKSADENIVVSLGGMANHSLYYSFYDELLDDADIYNYYDVMAFHGTYNVNTKLNNEIAGAHGLAPKKWWNSEGYFANYYKSGVLTDKYDGARAFAVSYLQNFKAGADIITAFSLLDIVGDEYRVFVNQNGGKTAPYGLFRSYPNIEPKLSALTAFNMFRLIDKDFEYIGEDRFDNVRAVSFKNGDSAMVAFWSGNSKGFNIPEKLSFVKNGKIYDFEGRILNGNYCAGNKIYFAVNVPIASLSGVLDTDKNNVLNENMQPPYFNAE